MPGRKLLVSDLDGTLLGDDDALSRFAEWLSPRRSLLRLVYASGRFFGSVVESVRETELPEPDAVIGGVGSEICAFPSGACVSGIECALETPWDAQRVREIVLSNPRVREQPAEFQSARKVSFFFDDADPRELEQIRCALRSGGVSADVVYSSNRDLDVLPAGINKGSAAAILADVWEIPAADVIVCGDSGNDLSMFETGFRGVVVANAHSALKSLAGEAVYHSCGSYAAGVLEGVRFWLGREPCE